MSSEWLGTVNLSIEFHEAAINLQSQLEASRTLTAPIYFLYHHSAELLLKSYLQANGCSEAEMKGLSHDLEKVTAKAKEHGLLVSQYLEKYISKIPHVGGQVEIRYYQGGWIKRLAPDYSRSSAIALFSEITPQVFARAKYPMPDWLLAKLGSGKSPPRSG